MAATPPPQDPNAIRASMTRRSRRRNARAGVTALGLVLLSVLLGLLLVSGFSGFTSSVASTTTTTHRTVPVTTTTLPPTTTTTTVPPTTTTSSTTTTSTTVAPPTTHKAVTTTTRPKRRIVTTTTAPAIFATVSVSDTPSFCTVTVRLSTGAKQSYNLDPYVSAPGDTYKFTAQLGGYQVDVTTVVDKKSECESSLANFRRA